jgi:hypothetical protein
MKARCEITAARLKAEKVTEDDHIRVETYWLVTFKIPASSINADEISENVNRVMDLNAEPVQSTIRFPKAANA